MTRRRLNRRSFLKGTALAAAAGTVPSFNILGAGSPNEKLNIAHIGLGKRASQQIVKFWNNDLMAPHCRSVAFADPWDDAGLQSWAVSLAQEVRKSYSHVPRFKDFRKMFDQMGKDIDAVAISGVTNMHYPAGMVSMQTGKHVFMQKPLCLTVEECRKLKETAEKNQLTSGWDSGDANSHCTYLNMLDSGVLGDVTEMHVSLGGGHTGGKPYPDGDHQVPNTIDWDVWLNVAAERPYVRGVLEHHWGTLHGFGIGWLGNGFAPHIMGPHVAALKLYAPVSITLVKKEPAKPGSHCIVELEYPARDGLAPCKLVAYAGEAHFTKSQDFLVNNMPLPDDMSDDRKQGYTNRRTSFLKGTKAMATVDKYPRIVPESKMRQIAQSGMIKQKHSPSMGEGNRFLQFVKACKAGAVRGHLTNLSDWAAPANEQLLLMYIAFELNKPGKKLLWDAPNMQFTNDEDANKYVRRPYRNGWGV